MTHSIQSPTPKAFTPKQMRDRLMLPGEVSRWLAEFICAAYWDKKRSVTSEQLKRFSKDLDVVNQILSYGPNLEDDTELFALACWCRAEYQLSEWADRA